MKKLHLYRTLVFSLIMLCGTPTVADSFTPEKALYVQSAKAKLLESPNFNAKVVASVPKGNSVDVLEKSESWIKVRFNDQIGWVSKLVLSINPPIEKNSILKGNITETKDHVRRRASNTATAAATRGLRADDRSRASDKDLSDYQALEQMESNTVSEKEVQQFSQQKHPESSQ